MRELLVALELVPQPTLLPHHVPSIPQLPRDPLKLLLIQRKEPPSWLHHPAWPVLNAQMFGDNATAVLIGAADMHATTTVVINSRALVSIPRFSPRLRHQKRRPTAGLGHLTRPILTTL